VAQAEIIDDLQFFDNQELASRQMQIWKLIGECSISAGPR
jgi:hypothetical protein